MKHRPELRRLLRRVFVIFVALYAITLLVFGWEPALPFAYMLIGGAALFLTPVVFVAFRENGNGEG
ncbi:MAG: hypothetical protein L0332_25485 [Chloroflexi bacterium]|nr:hypothetical protein [Chloroflexota bacterium]MCI0730051.1 hypothetical protein [Chloroflexota bacterium]